MHSLKKEKEGENKCCRKGENAAEFSAAAAKRANLCCKTEMQLLVLPPSKTLKNLENFHACNFSISV